MLDIDGIRQALREEDLRVLKSLGQNFLIDERALEGIVAAADLLPEETAVEVGPGLGALTFALAEKGARVLAIEKDKKMSAYLRKEIIKRGKADRIEVLSADVLRLDLPRLLEERGIGSYKVVANIPYYITSPIIKLFLETDLPPALMVLLVQKEVAERICAPAGDLSILALSVLLYGEPALIAGVPRASFYPAPKVDSAVLRIARIGRRCEEEDCKRLLRLVKIGFAAKRKKLTNNLAAGFQWEKGAVENLLKTVDISPAARAQDLSLEDWFRLEKAISGHS
jgi:16S rRNA (adenine1518-N6/adenine1519-N6)-dimethyltransferase